MQTPIQPIDSTWTILRLLQWTSDYFQSRDIDSPRMTAEILLAHALQLRRLDLYLRYDLPLGVDELALFKKLVKRRVRREPTAYITGSKGFWTLDLAVNSHVLIPRPETERLVETAVSVLPEATETVPSPRRVLELGTGSGAIILALAAERPANIYVALDKSCHALEVARRNAARNELGEAVQFLCSDWYDALKPGGTEFDLVVSNPPYIRSSDLAGLQPEIKEYEPVSALDGGEDGLDCIRHIVAAAPNFLTAGGWLLLEIGFDQGAAVERIASQASRYDKWRLVQDLSGNDRVACLRKSAIPERKSEN